jgi:hypothetical protein
MAQPATNLAVPADIYPMTTRLSIRHKLVIQRNLVSALVILLVHFDSHSLTIHLAPCGRSLIVLNKWLGTKALGSA